MDLQSQVVLMKLNVWVFENSESSEVFRVGRKELEHWESIGSQLHAWGVPATWNVELLYNYLYVYSLL